jgi:PAS domain S-box-containing protein
MPRSLSVGTLCDRLAELARARELKPLTMWLKLAANQTYLDDLMTESKSDGRIGVWDWDIQNNINYSNEANAEFFGIAPEHALRGHPAGDILAGIHPDDIEYFRTTLYRSTKFGGIFHAEYRVTVGGSVRWLRSNGQCALGDDGRPMRMLGSVIDITAERLEANVISLLR